jgi:hypothetical protein
MTRKAFANDLESSWSLVAVTASSNRAKADHDVTRWVPSRKAGRCFLATGTVVTKWRWSLSVDPAEKAALSEILRDCRDKKITVDRAAILSAAAGSTFAGPGRTDTTTEPGTASEGQVGPTKGVCPASHPIKGNVTSQNKIYHTPSSPYYMRTIPETCFRDETAATAAGFRAPR